MTRRPRRVSRPNPVILSSHAMTLAVDLDPTLKRDFKTQCDRLDRRPAEQVHRLIVCWVREQRALERQAGGRA